VTISGGIAWFLLKGDVAEAIYHQMGGSPNPKGAGCLVGLGKRLPAGGLSCVRSSAEKSGKAEYKCQMALDLRTGRLFMGEVDECDEDDQEELDRIQDKKGTKFPRLPYP
jgi:hypothetical protein